MYELNGEEIEWKLNVTTRTRRTNFRSLTCIETKEHSLATNIVFSQTRC